MRFGLTCHLTATKHTTHIILKQTTYNIAEWLAADFFKFWLDSLNETTATATANAYRHAHISVYLLVNCVKCPDPLNRSVYSVRIIYLHLRLN